MKTDRIISALIAALCIFVVSASFYIENVLGVEPCFLCLVQRGIFALLIIISLVAFFKHNSWVVRKTYAVSGLFLSVLGIAAAWRQVWLQNQPMSVAHNCLPRFSYLVENMPLNKTLDLFKGATQCSHYAWTYQGLSLAGWSVLAFSIVALFMVAYLLAQKCASKI